MAMISAPSSYKLKTSNYKPVAAPQTKKDTKDHEVRFPS